jgi:hypothetical protein
MNNKEIIAALRKFVGKRSGLDWRNYYYNFTDIDGVKAFRADRRAIAKDGKHGRELLTLCESLEIPFGHLVGSKKRLTLDATSGEVDYTPGQDMVTEYRAAVCRACASAIWNWLVDTERARNRAEVQAWIKARLGRSIANVWFN